MKTKLRHARWRLALLFATALTLGAGRSSAALLEVEQVIWGMDCAPCAYGMQRGLEKLPGVERVAISLNRGRATLTLARDNRLSLAAIRRVVRDGGFTPKEAQVRVEGILQAADGRLRLHTAGADYELRATAADARAWQQLRQARNGAKVIITGRSATGAPAEINVYEVTL